MLKNAKQARSKPSSFHQKGKKKDLPRIERGRYIIALFAKLSLFLQAIQSFAPQTVHTSFLWATTRQKSSHRDRVGGRI
jgi:hypothetical protein